MYAEFLANGIIQLAGLFVYLVIAFGLFTAVPALLLIRCIIFLRRGHGARRGLLLGFAAAVWASLCWLLVPYCGGYPNITGMVIGAAIGGPGSWQQEIAVHVLNFLFWPIFGWVVFWMYGKAKRQARYDFSSPPHC